MTSSDPIRARLDSANVEQMYEAIRAVLDLHNPRVDDALPMACIDSACDHAVECPEIQVTVCVECDAIREMFNDEGPMIAWPCTTIRAVAIGIEIVP